MSFHEEFNTWCRGEEVISGNAVVPISDNTPAIPLDGLSEEALQAQADKLENRHSIDNKSDDTRAWNSKTGIRKIFLTFDDGPSANTDKILDILDAYGVKATFFVVGKEGYTQQYQRIVKEGHTLAMHSFSHKYQEIYESEEAYIEDLDLGVQVLSA